MHLQPEYLAIAIDTAVTANHADIYSTVKFGFDEINTYLCW